MRINPRVSDTYVQLCMAIPIADCVDDDDVDDDDFVDGDIYLRGASGSGQ